MSIDGYGREWDLPASETCRVCGQPDNSGDCNHRPLSHDQALALGATVRATDAATLVLRYVPTVLGVDDPEVAAALWRDSLDREVERLEMVFGCYEVELHFEDLTSKA